MYIFYCCNVLRYTTSLTVLQENKACLWLTERFAVEEYLMPRNIAIISKIARAKKERFFALA